MKHALLAAVAVAALAFPGLAATATTNTHATHATHAARAASGAPVASAGKAVHQMLGAIPPFIRTGTKLGQGVILHRNPAPARAKKGRRPIGAAFTGPTAADNLTYNGPDQIPPTAIKTLPRVMDYNVNYAIFWVPDGYRTAPNYQSVIDQYFSDVANDSGTNGNVDSTTVQYYGDQDTMFYDSSYAGSALDTQAYPKGGCDKSEAAINAQADTGQPYDDAGDFHIHVLGTTVCLSDAQLEAEVKRFADKQGWPHGPNTEFFLYTAHNVDSCFYADGKVPGGTNLDNVCSYDYYCAYHSEFGNTTKTEYIYANMPWPNQAYSYPAQGINSPWKKSDCDTGEHPNGTGSVGDGTDPGSPTDADAADEVINVTSHEHNESTTDPTGYGWWVDSNSPVGGYENGDLCAWYWSNDSILGASDNGSYVTNVIGGDAYFLQGEWSNGDATNAAYSGCKWSHAIQQPETVVADAEPSVSSTSGDAPPTIGDTLTLHSPQWAPKGTVTEFFWVRCPAGSVAAVKSGYGKAIAAGKLKKFSADTGCTQLQDTFTQQNDGEQTDDYVVTSKDVHTVNIEYVLGWNGDEPAFWAFFTSVGGQPAINGDAMPSITPSGNLLPGTKLTANVGTCPRHR